MRLVVKAHRQHPHVDLQQAAVLADVAELPAARRARQGPFEHLLRDGAMLLDQQRRQYLAHHIVGPVAMHGEEGRIGVDDAELRVAQHQRIARCIEDCAVLLLARAQRFFGQLAMGDLAGKREHAAMAADLRRLEADLVPVHLAAAIGPLPFVAHRAAGLRLRHTMHGDLTVIRRRFLAELRQGHALEFVGLVAEHMARSRIDVDNGAGVPVLHEDRILRRLEDAAVARLGRAQRLFGLDARDFRADPRGKDPHDRLDARHVLQAGARDDRDDAKRRAVFLGKRKAGIGIQRHRAEDDAFPGKKSGNRSG